MSENKGDCIHGRKEIGKQIYSTLQSMESCRE